MGSSESTLQKFSTSFVWTIKDFSTIMTKDSGIKFPDFEFSASPDKECLNWKLELYPDNEFIAMALILVDFIKLSVTANLKYTLFDENHKETSYTKTSDDFIFSEFNNKLVITQLFDYGKYKSLQIVNKNNEINILCELKILDFQNNPDSVEIIKRKFSEKIVMDFTDMLSDESKSDVTLMTADGFKVPAHRLILSARSPVFADMLKDNTQAYFKLNIEKEILQEMLLFIYCGHSNRISELSQELLKAAVNYQITDLQKSCAVSLEKSLNVSDSAITLILAHRFQEKKLKKTSMHFIINNFADVVKTEGWKKLLLIPELMNEVCVLLGEN